MIDKATGKKSPVFYLYHVGGSFAYEDKPNLLRLRTLRAATLRDHSQVYAFFTKTSWDTFFFGAASAGNSGNDTLLVQTS
ncbi:unnamed protein product [Sphagnum troendelagicum]|jgi:hypothetical protein|uniref:Uncharacterized protein n=1 Tax=Sphagnum jensenii TaxID=128206 RepID=A0ABP0WCV8_9BRYO